MANANVYKLSELKVGGIIYEIYGDERLAHTSECFGQCDPASATITLDTGTLAADRIQQTLAHEIIHAMLHEAGYDEQNEEIVNRMGIVFHQVLADNYQFIGHDGIRDAVSEVFESENTATESPTIGYATENVRHGGDAE